MKNILLVGFSFTKIYAKHILDLNLEVNEDTCIKHLSVSKQEELL